MISRFLAFVLLYGWLLGPRLVALDLMWVFVALGCAMSLVMSGPRHVLGGSVGSVWALVMALMAYSVAIALYYATLDFGYAVSWFKALVFALSSVAVVKTYQHAYGDLALQRLVRDILLCGVVSALISLVIFLTPPLREVTGAMIIGTVANSYFGQYGIRIYDLSIGGGTAYGLFNLILLTLLYWYRHLFSRVVFAFIGVLLVLVIFLSARGVFTATALLLLLAALANFRFVSMMAGLLKFLGVALLGAAGFWFMVEMGLISTTLDGEQFSSFVENTLPWAFEAIFNAMEGEGFQSSTTDYMRDEFFFPPSVLGLLFGMGDSDPPSDSGLVRMVFSVGWVGFLVHLAVTALFVWHFFARVHDAAARKVIVAVSLLLLGFNLKELIFSNSRGLFGIFVVLFYGFIVLQRRQPSGGRLET